MFLDITISVRLLKNYQNYRQGNSLINIYIYRHMLNISMSQLLSDDMHILFLQFGEILIFFLLKVLQKHLGLKEATFSRWEVAFSLQMH